MSSKLYAVLFGMAALTGTLAGQPAPIHEYPLNENPITSGATAHDSVGSLNGVYNGNVTSAAGFGGVPNQAAHFDGLTSTVPLSGVSPLNVNVGTLANSTVTAWIKVDAGFDQADRFIYDESDSNDGCCGYRPALVLRLTTVNGVGGVLEFGIHQGCCWNFADVTNAPALNPNSWYLVAGVLSAVSGQSAYVFDDTGKMIGSVNISNFAPTDSPTNFATIGAWTGESCASGCPTTVNSPFLGSLQDVTFYNKDLTAAQLAALPLPGTTTGTPSGVSNTYVYNEITALASPGADSYNYPLISRTANRVIFTETVSGASGTNTLWAMNPDGSGLTKLDTDSLTDYYHFLSLSDDGSKALIWTLNKIRLVNTNGSGAQTLVTVDGNFGISQARITGDGSKVIFANSYDDNLTTSGSTPLAAGIYEINPDGAGLHAIVTETTLATFLGLSVGNIRGIGALNGMDVSSNGSKIVFRTSFAFSGEYLIAVNGDGSGLHTLIGPIVNVFTTGISEDGSTVWYNGVFVSLAPNEIGVIPFGGGARKALVTGIQNDGGGIATDIQLTTDGSKLLFGDNGSGTLYNTDGSGAAPLFVTTGGINGPVIDAGGSLVVTMDATAANFAFTTPARGLFPTVLEVGLLSRNPTGSPGAAPAIANPSANPPFILINGGSTSTLSATVTAPTAVGAVSARLLLPATGALGNDNAPILGAGANHLYSAGLQGGYDGQTGARTLRIQAETTDAGGKRHGSAVDLSGFSIVTTAPPSTTVTTNPSGLSITVDQITYNAPQEFFWTAGTAHTISVTSPQTIGSVQEVFAGWSDAGAQSHSVTALASSITYTASFSAAGQHPAFFAGENLLSGIVYYLQFPDSNLFGYYEYLSSSILYHFDMGYEAFISAPGGSIYFYDFGSGHWWYSSSSLFPYLYDFTLNTWIYYFPNSANPGHYTTNPREFVNLSTQKTFTM